MSTAAKVASGIWLASGAAAIMIARSVTAWIIPATGVRPPLFTLAVVRAIAPVAGIPPNRIEPMLATPWATSSQSALWRLPVMPSATTAESRDSIAASIAIVRAEGINSRAIDRLNGGRCGVGSVLGIPPNLLPIVSTPCTSNSATMHEAAITATIIPGTRGATRRKTTIRPSEPRPTTNVAGAQVLKFSK